MGVDAPGLGLLLNAIPKKSTVTHAAAARAWQWRWVSRRLTGPGSPPSPPARGLLEDYATSVPGLGAFSHSVKGHTLGGLYLHGGL